MTIQQKQASIVAEFSGMNSWEEKYKKIIELGKLLPAMPEELKTEDRKVRGCQSQVWLEATYDQGRIDFLADSDAMIVKGLIALLLDLYSGQTPDDILASPPSFIKDIGLDANLSPSRANGLASMVKQLRIYALAFKAKQGAAE